MKHLILNLACGMAGALLLIASVLLMCMQGVNRMVAFAATSGCVLLLISWAFFYQDKRDKIQYRTEQKIAKSDLVKGASLNTNIPFDKIRLNFLTLLKLDEMIVADTDYLSWNSGSFSEIRVTQIGNGNWICIYWLRASWAMTDSIMESICESNSIGIPAGFCGMEPHGMAIYSKGTLQIYPSLLEDDFKEEFLETVLSQGADFKRWMNAYYEER